MNYTVLALKWRPRRFGDLVGQQHVVQALVNSLAAERLHHAYLFAGTRGVGKTTVARILAKALNCEQGIATEPCGTCDNCVAIDQGRFVDLIEVDAASRTRVDDTRELLDNVQYAPTRGRFKVYLIDEVHMLSTHSFNALLKTLEEPPPHVKFLLATTDPQKLPVTVLSRCLQFNLKKLTVSQIRDQLASICDSEQVSAEQDGLGALAEAAAGSMRDAQSLLDQAIAFGGGAVTADNVRAMLGTIDRSQVLRILEALAERDGAALLQEAAALDQQAADHETALDALMSALQRIAVIQLVGERDPDSDAAELEPLASRFSPEEVQLYFQIALNGRRDLAWCHDGRVGFEMTLLRMLAFHPLADDGEPASAPPRRASTTTRVQRVAQSAQAAAEPAGRSRSVEQDQAVAPQRTQAPRPTVPAAAEAAEGQSMIRGNEGADAGGHTGEVPGLPAGGWPALLQAAEVRGMARQLADHCEVSRVAPGRIELVLRTERAHLLTERIHARLEAALADHLGGTLKLRITTGEPPRPTPADVREANETRRMREARETIEQDANVNALRSAFDAVVEADSIQPLESGTER